MTKVPKIQDRKYLDKELKKAENQQSMSIETDEMPPIDVVAFNELRSCSELCRLYLEGQLDISPGYQRDLVWSPTFQSRFVDSLAKQLPIPSMCITLDYKTERRQVVDGLQRISSIIKFLTDANWRLSKLEDIDSRISNKTVDFIKRSHPEIYRRIENTTLPVTVLRCDLSKRNHQEYIFKIFHRLNTGGLKLTNQEIRNCIYEGSFNELLKKIVGTELFIKVFSIDSYKKYRQSNQELVLRILSFSEDFENYRGPLSKHLNNFMSKYRKAETNKLNAFENSFISALKLLYERILKEEPLPRLSNVTMEALMVGIIVNFETLDKKESETLQRMYQKLRDDPEFSLDALKEGLAARNKVLRRLRRAVEIFQ